MTKLISRETKNEVIRLRFEENLPYSEIAKKANVGRSKASELCREEELRRKREIKEKAEGQEKSQTAQELEVGAFERYKQGKTPLDLVTDGFTTAEIAEDLWNRFVKLKKISDHPPGFDEGYKTGYTDAKKCYKIGIPCCRCGNTVYIENGEKILSDLQCLMLEVIKTNFQFVDSNGKRTAWNWHHVKCPEQAG